VRLQRANGDQAFQGMLQTDAQELEAGSTGTLSPRFGYGFGRISIHSPTAGAIQTKLAINRPGDIYEQEADCVSEQILRMPEPQLYSASAIAGAHPKDQAEKPGQEHERLQTKRLQTGNLGQTAAPPIVHEVLASPGHNVGLHAWDIASDGTPIRRPVLAGTGVPSGKGTSGPKGGLASKTVPPAPVDPPARTVKGEIETKGTPSAPPTAPPQPSPAAPAAVPTVGSVGQKPPVVSSRDLAAELVRTETQVRRMELFTKAAWYSLGAWSAKNALEDVARAVNMAAATFAQGSPFEKEIQHARALESTAREVQEYYASLDIFKNQMPSKGDPEWNSWYDVQQAQLNYLWIEIPLHDALKSVKEARSNLEAQIRSLNDAMAWRVTALVMLPTTSLVYAEAALFAGAGRKIGGSLLTARGSYLDAQRSIEHLGRLARSAAKVLELRLRQLGTTGSFHGMSLDEVRSSSQEKFTSR